ncbi:hypothetical protein [Nocardiopsis rhodophaea]|uniref:hypothetical protein n=1 Tax=Nocardiopsis rhodophaea TaxID=280238 RepID=UPI0031E47DA2
MDFVHVLEYLWGAAWSFHASGDRAAEDWVALQALAVLAGGSARVDALIADRAEGLDASRRGGAQRCVRYLRGHEEFLGNDRALSEGWPIATGVIEGACRHLIANRLDITRARWGLEGAEAFLKLRAVRANGDVDAYWRFHLDREHERLYRVGDQVKHDLSVCSHPPSKRATPDLFNALRNRELALDLPRQDALLRRWAHDYAPRAEELPTPHGLIVLVDAPFMAEEPVAVAVKHPLKALGCERLTALETQAQEHFAPERLHFANAFTLDRMPGALARVAGFWEG